MKVNLCRMQLLHSQVIRTRKRIVKLKSDIKYGYALISITLTTHECFLL